MIVAIWIFALIGLGLWSLVGWGLHAVLTLDARQLDGVKPLVDRIPFGDWLSLWLPGWQELLRFAVELTQTTLGWLGGIAPLVAWVVWAVGALLILGGAGVITLLVVLLRDKPARPVGGATR